MNGASGLDDVEPLPTLLDKSGSMGLSSEVDAVRPKKRLWVFTPFLSTVLACCFVGHRHASGLTGCLGSGEDAPTAEGMATLDVGERQVAVLECRVRLRSPSDDAMIRALLRS